MVLITILTLKFFVDDLLLGVSAILNKTILTLKMSFGN